MEVIQDDDNQAEVRRKFTTYSDAELVEDLATNPRHTAMWRFRAGAAQAEIDRRKAKADQIFRIEGRIGTVVIIALTVAGIVATLYSAK